MPFAIGSSISMIRAGASRSWRVPLWPPSNLDQLLWTFAQGSFIPHRIVSSIPLGATVEPVVITPGEIPLDGFAVLICDGAASFDFLLRYQMVVHFVLLDEAEKRQDSRLLWQTVKGPGNPDDSCSLCAKGETAFLLTVASGSLRAWGSRRVAFPSGCDIIYKTEGKRLTRSCKPLEWAGLS